MNLGASYFDGPASRLFGWFHEPRGDHKRSTGVLLCQPLGHEYIRCHRALRLLAEQFCWAGFPVFRFDYGGTGDSEGGAELAGIDAWRDDVRCAADRLVRLSGSGAVSAVGLRLGASLAFLASARGANFDALVLWDPVVSGRRFLDELSMLHRDKLRSIPGRVTAAAGKGTREFLGFSYPAALLDQLEKLDLTREKPAQAGRILLIESEGTTALPGLTPSGGQASGAIQSLRSTDRPWMWDPDRATIPRASLQTIVEWIKSACP